MKALGLFAFAAVFLLSSACADSKGKGNHGNLLEPKDHTNGEALQRRKPPVKIPGPAFKANDQHPEESNLKQLSEDKESKNLATDNNKKHAQLDSHNNGKEKDNHKHVVNGDNNEDNGEESKEERSKSLRNEHKSP